jgi:hypothetical protein
MNTRAAMVARLSCALESVGSEQVKAMPAGMSSMSIRSPSERLELVEAVRAAAGDVEIEIDLGGSGLFHCRE